jgi:hypothetical protein
MVAAVATVMVERRLVVLPRQEKAVNYMACRLKFGSRKSHQPSVKKKYSWRIARWHRVTKADTLCCDAS